MSRIGKRLGTVLFTALVAAGLTFGASQALSVDPAGAVTSEAFWDYCEDDPGEYGGSTLCDGGSGDPDCENWCVARHQSTGSCILTTYDGWCCMCAV